MKNFHNAATCRRLRGAVAVLCVFAASAAAADTALTGRVTQASTGLPIVGATVSTSTAAPGAPLAQATTDSDGRYTLAYACAAAACPINASASGYAGLTLWYDGGNATAERNFPLLFGNETSISGRLALPPGATYSPTGFHLEKQDGNGDWQAIFPSPAPLDAGGYRYSGVAPGTYRLCYDDLVQLRNCYDGHDEGAFAGFGFTPFTIAAGDHREGVDLAPKPGYAITGRVFDRHADSGTWFSPAGFLVYDENGAVLENSRYLFADMAGNYTYTGLAPGRYHVAVKFRPFLQQFYPDADCTGACDPLANGGLVTVAAGSGAQGVDFGLAPYAVLRLRVLASDTGLEIPQPVVGSWTAIPFGVSRLPAWYDTSTGEHVVYAQEQGDYVAAAATGYVPRFVGFGNCTSMSACLSAHPRFMMPRGEERSATLRLSPADGYIFANDFE